MGKVHGLRASRNRSYGLQAIGFRGLGFPLEVVRLLIEAVLLTGTPHMGTKKNPGPASQTRNRTRFLIIILPHLSRLLVRNPTRVALEKHEDYINEVASTVCSLPFFAKKAMPWHLSLCLSCRNCPATCTHDSATFEL